MPVRPLGRRKTREAIEKIHAALDRQASRKQLTTDPRSRVAADFLVLDASLPRAETKPNSGRQISNHKANPMRILF